MDYFNIITAIISSSLITSILSSLFTFFTTRYSLIRSQKVKYITEERQKWRQDIKEKIVKFNTAETLEDMKKIKYFIQLSLNPDDEEDRKIIKCMERIIENKIDKDVKELQLRVAILLKHDWERVKKEVTMGSIKFDRAETFKKLNDKDA
ncbi:hypothetical protein [Salinicoccus roseus]|uniref:hypothetical protein n=1 Tax=Salinicoccus roseus TaxID=45670 RepID=UPI003DA0C5F5